MLRLVTIFWTLALVWDGLKERPASRHSAHCAAWLVGRLCRKSIKCLFPSLDKPLRDAAFSVQPYNPLPTAGPTGILSLTFIHITFSWTFYMYSNFLFYPIQTAKVWEINSRFFACFFGGLLGGAFCPSVCLSGWQLCCTPPHGYRTMLCTTGLHVQLSSP